MLRVGVIVVAYGDQPLLSMCIESCLTSQGVDTKIIIVNNGCVQLAKDETDFDHPLIEIIDPGENLGYAAACNLAAAMIETERQLIFINPDVVVQSDCFALLAAECLLDTRSLVTAQIRLMDEPQLLNCCGNLYHPLGISWSNLYRRPISSAPLSSDVPLISGALFAVHNDFWQELEGFDEIYFAYFEDVEISWRAWEIGGSIRYLSTAIGFHNHEFSRHASKMYLLDRNRLITVFSHYRLLTLLLLAPVAIIFELLLTIVAVRQGWFGSRIKSMIWIVSNARKIAQKRIDIQKKRKTSDVVLLSRASMLMQLDGYPVNSVLLRFQKPVVLYLNAVRYLSN